MSIKGKIIDFNMEEYIDQIEQFLRGQMTKQEEIVFKSSLISNIDMRLFAFIVAYILRTSQKTV